MLQNARRKSKFERQQVVCTNTILEFQEQTNGFVSFNVQSTPSKKCKEKAESPGRNRKMSITGVFRFDQLVS